MSDYSTASLNAQANLASSSDGGIVEEYEVGPGGRRRVKRGNVKDQVAAALLLEGIASRRAAGGIMRVAKVRDAQ